MAKVNLLNLSFNNQIPLRPLLCDLGYSCHMLVWDMWCFSHALLQGQNLKQRTKC